MGKSRMYISIETDRPRKASRKWYTLKNVTRAHKKFRKAANALYFSCYIIHYIHVYATPQLSNDDQFSLSHTILILMQQHVHIGRRERAERASVRYIYILSIAAASLSVSFSAHMADRFFEGRPKKRAANSCRRTRGITAAFMEIALKC